MSSVGPARWLVRLAACATACATPDAPPPRRPIAAVPTTPPLRPESAPAPPVVDARGTSKLLEPAAPAIDEQWGHPLPVDHGVRGDDAGQGHFRAPRYHGEHNGLDLLAPLGTPALAVCAGHARGGASPSFGKWVQLVCAAPELGQGEPRGFVSSFYSHLARVDVPNGEWQPVQRGTVVGAVGKTGNASGADVRPHLHFETIAHVSEERARAEAHSGRDQSTTEAATRIVAAMEVGCLAPRQLAPKLADAHRGRRLDPFLLLRCAGAAKPPLTLPGENISDAVVRWKLLYESAEPDLDGPYPVGP